MSGELDLEGQSVRSFKDLERNRTTATGKARPVKVTNHTKKLNTNIGLPGQTIIGY